MVLVATQVKRRRGTTAENDAFTGAEGEITVDTEKHQLRVHDGETQGGFVIGGGSGSGRNIGDIFYTTRTDTGLAGAVECNGATYNTTDYTGEGSIGELLEGGLLDYISLTDYATAISTKGYCDKIGWDGTGTTSFRVPKLAPKRHVVKVQEPTADNNYTWYRLYNDGWVEQGGCLLNASTGSHQISVPIEMNDVNTLKYSAKVEFVFISGTIQNQGVHVDLSRQFSTTGFGCFSWGATGHIGWQVSGQSAIVSDPTERAMIQLTGGATDEAFATCSEVLADVAGLKDMNNITATGKETVVGWGMPDYSAVVSKSSGSSAPTNGWAVAHGKNATVTYSINGVSVAQGDWASGVWSGNWNLQIMVSAGDIVAGGSWKFIPCKGA